MSDYFARANIPIDSIHVNAPTRTIESASVIIMGEADISPTAGLLWADCGAVPIAEQVGHGSVGIVYRMQPVAATRAYYNFLVRADSTQSTILATVRWSVPERLEQVGTNMQRAAGAECNTRGVWEDEAEAAVKSGAEAAARGRRP